MALTALLLFAGWIAASLLKPAPQES